MTEPYQTKSDESGRQRRQPDRVWLPLGAAAERLGINHETARKRIERGTLAGEKRGGRWFVEVDKSDEFRQPDRTYQDAPRRQTRQPDSRSGDQAALIGHLSAENAWLRVQIETHVRDAADARQLAAAERERADVLARESLRRVEALTAGVSKILDRNQTPDDTSGTDVPKVHPADHDDTAAQARQARDVAPSATIGPGLSNESNTSAASTRRSGFTGWWDRLMGR